MDTNFQVEVQRHSGEVFMVGTDVTSCYDISVAIDESSPVRRGNPSQTPLTCSVAQEEQESNRMEGFLQVTFLLPLTCSHSPCPTSLSVRQRRSSPDVRPSGRRSSRCRHSCSPVTSPAALRQEKKTTSDDSTVVIGCLKRHIYMRPSLCKQRHAFVPVPRFLLDPDDLKE